MGIGHRRADSAVDPVAAFHEALREHNLDPNEMPVADGKIHQFRNAHSKGWYSLHLDPHGAHGAFGDYRSMGVSEYVPWSLYNKPLSEGQRQTLEYQAGREVISRKRQNGHDAHAKVTAKKKNLPIAVAAAIAAEWNAAKEARTDGAGNPMHHYLLKKGVTAHGLRELNGNLLVPMYRDETLVGLQKINAWSSKKYATGSLPLGASYTLPGDDAIIFIGEGYATCATVYEALERQATTVIAFTAGNLSAVAAQVRAKHPEAEITIIADDDQQNTPNTGIQNGCDAARTAKGTIAVPDFEDVRERNKGTDFNDLLTQLVAEGASLRRARKILLRQLGSAQDPDALFPARINVLTAGGLMRAPVPEREFIVNPFMTQQSIGMIHAWRGDGKTIFLMALAVHIASGQDFLCFEIPKPRKVLYVDGEMAMSDMKERLQSIWASFPSCKEAYDNGFLRFITPEEVEGAMPNLNTTEGQDELDSYMGDAEVICLDNVTALVRTQEAENTSEYWRMADQYQLKLRRERRSVIWLHHDNKVGGQRGASGKEDHMSFVVQLKKPKEEMEDESLGAHFEFRYEKKREHSKGLPMKDLYIEARRAAGGRYKWKSSTLEGSTYKHVCELTLAGYSPTSIAKELNVSKATVSYHQAKGRQAGDVE